MKKAITNKKRAVALCTGAAALLIVALTAVASGAGFGGGSVPVEKSRPISIGAPGAGTATFGVLRPATAAGAQQLPVTVQTVLANPPTSNAADASRGTVTAFGSRSAGVGGDIGVAEVDGGLCIFAAGADYQGAAVGSCPSLAAAEAGEGYVAIPSLSPNSVRIVGVVPNGVVSLAVDSGENGTVDRTVSVASNLYQVDLAEVPTTIAGLTSSGKQAFKIQLPLDQFAG